jgi:hypothetical protein
MNFKSTRVDGSAVVWCSYWGLRKCHVIQMFLGGQTTRTRYRKLNCSYKIRKVGWKRFANLVSTPALASWFRLRIPYYLWLPTSLAVATGFCFTTHRNNEELAPKIHTRTTWSQPVSVQQDVNEEMRCPYWRCFNASSFCGFPIFIGSLFSYSVAVSHSCVLPFSFDLYGKVR